VPLSALRTSATAAALVGLPAAARAEGMPQFDFSTFPGQVFWLVVTFAVLFTLMSTIVLPTIGKTIDRREAKIQADLDAAQTANDAARASDEAQAKVMAEARGKAEAAIHAAADAAASETAAQMQAVSTRLGADIAAAERRIDAQKVEALSELKTMAGELVASILDRLVGSADRAQVSRAVDDAAKAVRR
jgi:F-type H+-transporting ATPase subunit b